MADTSSTTSTPSQQSQSCRNPTKRRKPVTKAPKYEGQATYDFNDNMIQVPFAKLRRTDKRAVDSRVARSELQCGLCGDVLPNGKCDNFLCVQINLRVPDENVHPGYYWLCMMYHRDNRVETLRNLLVSCRDQIEVARLVKLLEADILHKEQQSVRFPGPELAIRRRVREEIRLRREVYQEYLLLDQLCRYSLAPREVRDTAFKNDLPKRMWNQALKPVLDTIETNPELLRDVGDFIVFAHQQLDAIHNAADGIDTGWVEICNALMDYHARVVELLQAQEALTKIDVAPRTRGPWELVGDITSAWWEKIGSTIASSVTVFHGVVGHLATTLKSNVFMGLW